MISWPHLLVLFVVILLVFGTKKLRTLGSDLGESIKGFKKAMGDDEKEKEKEKLESQNQDAQDANFINKETQTTSSNDKKE